jgi:GntR family transcriptional regulator, trigonelline degradation regulator
MAELQSEVGAFRPIGRTAAPLRQRVVEALRDSIVHGRLAPGARLIERELIERMGVSRTVLREALRQLEAEGLIDVVANKGAVVRTLSLAEAQDLYAIRAVLEGLAARLFTDRASDEARSALADTFSRTASAYEEDDPEKIVAAKNDFYDALFRGAESETLSTMIEALQARVWRWRVLGHAHPERSDERSVETVRNLAALVAAIEARDAERAEGIAREEVTKAASEAMRLLANETAASDPAEDNSTKRPA